MIIHECEQGTDEWFKLRAGKPTSSEFSNLVTGLGKESKSLPKYAAKLAGEKLVMSTRGEKLDDGFDGNKYTERGHELEPESRADYAMTNQVKVQEVGFITDDLLQYGASTDGLVGDDGVVEFKNLTGTRMIELMMYVASNKKIPPEYIPQLQGELLVTEREWVDIVFYHPQIDPVVHRVHPDPDYQETLLTQINRVIVERDRIYKLIKP